MSLFGFKSSRATVSKADSAHQPTIPDVPNAGPVGAPADTPAAVIATPAAEPSDTIAPVAPLGQEVPGTTVASQTTSAPPPEPESPAGAPIDHRDPMGPSVSATPSRLAFLDKGSSMTSQPPKAPLPPIPPAPPRGDMAPRRVFDGPGASIGLGAPSVTPSRGSSDGPSTAPADGQRRLIVGRDISLAGEIASCDILVVEGTVEAKLRDGHSIEIAESGLFKGSVEIDDADIGGRFEGDLVVRHRLVVRSTGSITGSIVYGELEVESGGRLVGAIKIYEPNATTIAPEPMPEPVPAPMPPMMETAPPVEQNFNAGFNAGFSPN